MLAETPRRSAPASIMASASGAGLDHGLGVGQGADAAGGLDAEVGADGLAHEADVLDGCAAGGETGGGLHEVRAALDGEAARADLLLIGEQAALDDDLEVRAAGVGGVCHGGDVGADDVVVTGLELADVDDHVDLARTGGHHVGGLGGLGGGGHGAQREADDGAGHDVGALEGGGDARDPIAVHAYGGGVQLARLSGDAVDLLGGGVRLEPGVVHVLGEFGFGGGPGGPYVYALESVARPVASFPASLAWTMATGSPSSTGSP